MWHIPGAINMPLTENKLATGRPGVLFVPYAEEKMTAEHGALINP
jgi:hypothetical protein